jgi:hypothetical protein
MIDRHKGAPMSIEGTQPRGRTRWQEYVISKAYFLENERNHGEFVPGLSELDSQGQILAYAVLLGVGQHLFTRFVDRRAETVLNSLPSKENPSPTGERQTTKRKETRDAVHA